MQNRASFKTTFLGPSFYFFIFLKKQPSYLKRPAHCFLKNKPLGRLNKSVASWPLAIPAGHVRPALGRTLAGLSTGCDSNAVRHVGGHLSSHPCHTRVCGCLWCPRPPRPLNSTCSPAMDCAGYSWHGSSPVRRLCGLIMPLPSWRKTIIFSPSMKKYFAKE